MRHAPASVDFSARQRGGAVDQRDVGEGLREVAEELAGRRVDLLGVEPDVIGVAQHPAEDPLGPLALADHGQRLGQPEGADREGALLSLQPVGVTVAVDQLAVGAGELPRDGADGPVHPRMVPGKEPHHRDRERGGIERVVVVGLDERLVSLRSTPAP